MGADVKTVAIRLDLINAQFKGGLRESAGAADGFSKSTTLGFAAAGTAAVAFAKHSTDAYVTYGKEMMKLSRISGESIETSSKMNFAAQQSGVSTEQLTTGVKFLEKSIAAGRAEFGKLGVSVVDSNGRLRSTHSVLLDTADALSKLTDAQTRTDYITKIFGRSGLAMGAFLAKGAAGIRQLEEDTQKYGLVLTKDNLPAIQENIKAHREFEAASKGLSMAVGQYMLPAFTKVEQGLAAIPGPLMGILPPATAAVAGLSAIVVVGGKVVSGAQKLAEVIPNLSSKVAGGAVAIGGAVAVYEIWNHRMQEAYANASKLGDVVTKGNMTGGFDSLAGRIHNIDGQIASLNAEIADSHSPFDADYRAELEAGVTQLQKSKEATQGQIDMIKALSAASGNDVEAVKTWLNKEAAAGHVFETTGVAIQAYTGKIDAATAGTEEGTKAVEAMTSATNDKNKAEQDAVGSQFALIDAANKVGDVHRALETAQRGVTDAYRAVGDAQDKAVEADQARVDASNKVTDALQAQRDAQRELTDVLAEENTEDDALKLEAAKVALAEERKRQGVAPTAPGMMGDEELERRKNWVAMRRAEMAVDDAAGAHARRVEEAQKKVADADKAVADARRAASDAAKAAVDAHRAVGDAAYKVRDAEMAVRDANLNVIKSGQDLDIAINNNELAFGSSKASIEKNKEMLDDWVARGIITRDQANEMGAMMLFLAGATDMATEALKRKVAGDAKAAAVAARPRPGVTNSEREARANGPVDRPVGDTVNPNNPEAVANRGPVYGEYHAYAAGTTAMADGPFLAGEYGPELGMKRGSTVSMQNARSTSRILAGIGATPTPLAAGQSIVMHVHPSPGMDERKLADAVVRRIRSGPS